MEENKNEAGTALLEAVTLPAHQPLETRMLTG